jgi:hypothetical protein
MLIPQRKWTSTIDIFSAPKFKDSIYCIDKSYFRRAILTTTIENVDKINKLVMSDLPALETDTKRYISANSLADEEQQCLHLTEFFYTRIQSGMPPQKLYFKKNVPIILLRNLKPNEGLLNGRTRLSVIH